MATRISKMRNSLRHLTHICRNVNKFIHQYVLNIYLTLLQSRFLYIQLLIFFNEKHAVICVTAECVAHNCTFRKCKHWNNDNWNFPSMNVDRQTKLCVLPDERAILIAKKIAHSDRFRRIICRTTKIAAGIALEEKRSVTDQFFINSELCKFKVSLFFQGAFSEQFLELHNSQVNVAWKCPKYSMRIYNRGVYFILVVNVILLYFCNSLRSLRIDFFWTYLS